jgi:hypothetical protein
MRGLSQRSSAAATSPRPSSAASAKKPRARAHHADSFEGRVGSVPVYNVAVPVLGREYHLFKLEAPSGGVVH